SVSIGSTAVVSYTYNDHNGKLNTLTYANGYTEDYVYDDLDRLTEIWYTQGSGTRTLAYSYVYTADGALASFTDHRTDQQTVYQYDISGRLTHVATLEDDAYVLKTDYIYDDLSQLSRQTHTLTYATAPYWSDSSTDTLSFYDWYMYDTEGRLSRVITGGNGLGVNTYYHYDSLGRATAKFFIAHDNGYKNDVFYTYQTKNDLSGMLVSEYRSNVCGVDVNEYRYTYDKNGNILTIRNDYATGQANYVYDEFDQLISEVNYDLGKTYTYTYDNAGNITSVTTKDNSTGSSYTETYNYYSATTGRGDRLSSITLNEYESISLSYDALGNVSHYIIPFPYENVTLTWEGRQLVSFFPDDNGDYPFCYTYDDEGRRVQKSTEGQIYTNYVYEGDLLLYETGTYGTIVYIYDGGSTPIGMMYRASSETATWQTFWYEKNLQGDVVAVYSHDGVKLVSYAYDAWGNTTTTYHNGGSSTGAYYNPIRYRSYYYDREIELYYLGTRWYSPRFHRFLSPDNVDVTAATPGALTDKNLYAYCDNNPVMRVDYTGEFWNILIGAFAGAITGFFVSAVS
ncbi:MAG: RHS repeat-associated core domain-containing protein, partial [Clostridia bacterium]|nr:RHS repeat-associated core domain-containing protein [Clostridia bacterium]